MDLGLLRRQVLLAGGPDELRDACLATLSEEGAEVSTTSLPDAADLVVEHGRVDVVVALLPMSGSGADLRTSVADLTDRWLPVEQVAAAFRAALPGMTSRCWGRLVSVLPSAVKSLGDHSDEPGAVAGLAVLGMHKSVVADAARHGVCTNAVLRDVHTPFADVASTVAFLVSGPASYLQGVTIGLDGARSAAMF